MEAEVLCDTGKKPWHTLWKFLTWWYFPLERNEFNLFVYVHVMFWRSKHAAPTSCILQLMACFAVSWLLCVGWQPSSAFSEESGALCCVQPSCCKRVPSNLKQVMAKRCLHSLHFGNDGLWVQGEIIVSLQLHVCGKYAMCRATCRGQQWPTVLSAYVEEGPA